MSTKTTKKIVLPIEGMTCASCVSHVEGALNEVEGVTLVTVNLATEQATVEFDDDRALARHGLLGAGNGRARRGI